MAAQIEVIKWIPKTKFMVDGFNFKNPECSQYFLTHAHGDHTCGLNKSFNFGLVYCTPITARLMIEERGYSPKWIRTAPLDTPFTVDGVTVEFIEANHCPGACLILFKIPQSKARSYNVLHCGDFRFQKSMAEHKALKGLPIDVLFLDTTYGNQKWKFPDQSVVVQQMANLMKMHRVQDPEVVFLVNTYHIGKERCFFGSALLAGLRVWVSRSKEATMKRLELPQEWMDLLVPDQADADIIVSGFGVNPPAINKVAGDLRCHVIGFQCSGWSYQKSGIKKREQDGTLIYGIPYSEHSSWNELRDCVRLLRPIKVVPTVNVKDKASIDAMVNKFADLLDLSKSRSHMDMYMRKRKASPGRTPTLSNNSSDSTLKKIRVVDLATDQSEVHTILCSTCQRSFDSRDAYRVHMSSCTIRSTVPETSRCESDSKLNDLGVGDNWGGEGTCDLGLQGLLSSVDALADRYWGVNGSDQDVRHQSRGRSEHKPGEASLPCDQVRAGAGSEGGEGDVQGGTVGIQVPGGGELSDGSGQEGCPWGPREFDVCEEYELSEGSGEEWDSLHNDVDVGVGLVQS